MFERRKVYGRVGVGMRTGGRWARNRGGVFDVADVWLGGVVGGCARSVAVSAQWFAWRRA